MQYEVAIVPLLQENLVLLAVLVFSTGGGHSSTCVGLGLSDIRTGPYHTWGQNIR